MRLFHGDVQAALCTEIAGQAVVVAAGRGLFAQALDLATGVLRAGLTGPRAWTDALACADLPGQPVVLIADTVARLGVLELWNPLTGDITALGEMTAEQVNAVAYTRAGNRHLAVMGDSSGAVHIWDLVAGQPVAVLEGHATSVEAVACTTIGGRPVAVTGSGDRTVRVWDLITHQEIAQLDGHSSGVVSVACVAVGGRTLALSGDTVGTAYVWDLSGEGEPMSLQGHDGAVYATACAAPLGGVMLVTGSRDATVRQWDVTTGICTAVLPQPGSVHALAIGPEGELVVGCGWDVIVMTPGSRSWTCQ